MHNTHALTAPSSPTSVPLLVALLGQTRLTATHRTLPVPGRGKSDALLLGLALFQRGAVAREQLLEQLWPGQSASLAGVQRVCGKAPGNPRNFAFSKIADGLLDAAGGQAGNKITLQGSKE